MNRSTICFASIILTSVISTARPAFGENRNDFQSEHYEICGFKFTTPKSLTVVKSPISSATLRTRVDNERYDACPYNVTMVHGHLKMRLDFSREIVLEQVTNFDEDSPVRTAYFEYDEDGWHSSGNDIELESNEISTLRTPESLTVSAILTRKNSETRRNDYCFSVVAITTDKYATGAVCAPKKSDLVQLSSIFRTNQVVSAERKK